MPMISRSIRRVAHLCLCPTITRRATNIHPMSTTQAAQGVAPVTALTAEPEVPVEVPELALSTGQSDQPFSGTDRRTDMSATPALPRKRPHGPDLTVPDRNKKRPPPSETTIDINTLPDTRYYFEGLQELKLESPTCSLNFCLIFQNEEAWEKTRPHSRAAIGAFG